jgi:hypothetical protein
MVLIIQVQEEEVEDINQMVEMVVQVLLYY